MPLQVFFEAEARYDVAAFDDGLAHAGAAVFSPFAVPLIRLGLHPGAARHRRNYASLRRTWKSLLSEIYARPLPEDSRALWACLRRAFPDAMQHAQQYEGALINAAMIYGAGSETTATAIAMSLGALALDHDFKQRLEQVCLPAASLHDLPRYAVNHACFTPQRAKCVHLSAP